MLNENYDKTFPKLLIFDSLKNKATKGFLYLFWRRVVLYLFAFLTNVILARKLSPVDFGSFTILSFLITILFTFSDLGLSVAIIRAKKIEIKDLYVIFTAQILFTLVLILIFYLLSSKILYSFYGFRSNMEKALLIMLFAYILNVLAIVPISFLERQLEFKNIAFIEVVSSLAYQSLAICFSILNMGLWALILGYFSLCFVRAFLSYYYSKWKPKIYFEKARFMSFANFGLSFQLSNFVNLFKDSFAPIFVGKFSGNYALGLIDWAKKIAIIPTIFTESYGRVALPTFSKMQENKEDISRSIESSIRAMTFIVFPISLYIVIFAKDLITIIYTDKWIPALGALYFFSIGSLLIGLVTPIYQGILALGNSKSILKLSILLLILEWGLGIPAVIFFGFIGIAMVSGPIAFLFLYLYNNTLIREKVYVDIWNSIRNNLLVNVINSIIVIIIYYFLPHNSIYLLLVSIFYLISYFILSIRFNYNNLAIIIKLLNIAKEN